MQFVKHLFVSLLIFAFILSADDMVFKKGQDRPHFTGQTASSTSLGIRYNLGDTAKLPGIFKLREGVDGKAVEHQVNKTYGTYVFSGLKPETEYIITNVLTGQELTLKTLYQPKGKLLTSYAVLSDTHINMATTGKGARMHRESRKILTEIVNELNEKKIPLLLIAGDLTDSSKMEQLETAAGILSQFKGKLLVVPGNHDMVKAGAPKDAPPEQIAELKKKGRAELAVFHKRWEELFGAFAHVNDFEHFTVLGLNTSRGLLGVPENLAAVNAVKPDKFLIVFSHMQLKADDYYTHDSSRVVKDGDKNGKPIIDKIAGLSGKNAIVYIGHKNLATSAQIGQVLQLNMPQTTQFPAGYISVDVYEDGLMHIFHPLDDFRNEFSRRASNAAFADRRDLKVFQLWNFWLPK